MQRSRPRYTPEFRQQMVALVRSGRTPESLSREVEPSAQSISANWSNEARGAATAMQAASTKTEAARKAAYKATGKTEKQR